MHAWSGMFVRRGGGWRDAVERRGADDRIGMERNAGVLPRRQHRWIRGHAQSCPRHRGSRRGNRRRRRRGGPPWPPQIGAGIRKGATTGGCPYRCGVFTRAGPGACPYRCADVVIAGCDASVQNDDHETLRRWGETLGMGAVLRPPLATELLRTHHPRRRIPEPHPRIHRQ